MSDITSFRNETNGAPRRWIRPGVFGVLISSSDAVSARTFDASTGRWTDLVTASDAHDYGAMVRRAQPGIEFETMRLEDGTWRDFHGRTSSEVIALRWARP